METITSDDQHKLISSFVEITDCHTIKTAIPFLKATNWKLENAINLFSFLRSIQTLTYQNPLEQYHDDQLEEQQIPYEKIPLPLPSRMDTLYDDSTTREGPESTLSSFYRPSLDLPFKGMLQAAICFSAIENRWLLVNLLADTEFASHALNRDLWSNEAVSQAIKSNFILLQAYDDDTKDGKKVSSFYKIESVHPVILLIDPITGEKMRTWSGVIEAHSFVDDLMKYIDYGPNQHIASLPNNKSIRTDEIITCPPSNKRIKVEKINSPRNDPLQDSEGSCCEMLFSYLKEETCSSSNHTDLALTCVSSDMVEFLVLTEEPKGDCDRSLVCSICVRFPDGRRKQRKFFKSEPIQLLWSFCYAHMEESERKKAFKLLQAIPGATKTLDYGANVTFEQSGLANVMISVTWG